MYQPVSFLSFSSYSGLSSKGLYGVDAGATPIISTLSVFGEAHVLLVKREQFHRQFSHESNLRLCRVPVKSGGRRDARHTCKPDASALIDANAR